MVRTTYDSKHDALYVKLLGARIATSREHAIDSDLVLNYDRDGDIVGIQFLLVSLVHGMWQAHPARRALPGALRDEVDRFMGWMDAGPPDPEQCAARRVPPQWVLEAHA